MPSQSTLEREVWSAFAEASARQPSLREGWWRRRESDQESTLITRKLQILLVAQNAPGAQIAVPTHVSHTQSCGLFITQKSNHPILMPYTEPAGRNLPNTKSW